jgi:hypothetical protein
MTRKYQRVALTGVTTGALLYGAFAIMPIEPPALLTAVLAGCLATIAGILARRIMPDA